MGGNKGLFLPKEPYLIDHLGLCFDYKSHSFENGPSQELRKMNICTRMYVPVLRVHPRCASTHNFFGPTLPGEMMKH